MVHYPRIFRMHLPPTCSWLLSTRSLRLHTSTHCLVTSPLASTTWALQRTLWSRPSIPFRRKSSSTLWVQTPFCLLPDVPPSSHASTNSPLQTSTPPSLPLRSSPKLSWERFRLHRQPLPLLGTLNLLACLDLSSARRASR